MKMAKMRKMLTHPRKNESGQGVLAIVLILLMLGAIILTPLLVFMNTGLKAGGVYESKMQEFYAADAGVEDAIWNITYANLTTPANYTLADKVNNRTTNVTIEPISGGGYSGYKIISTATSDSSEGNTTIECDYGALDYSGLLENAITSNGIVDLKPGVNVTGNISTSDCSVVDNCDYNCASCPNWTCCVDCPNCANCCSEEPLSWPTAETLSELYYNKTKDYPYSSNTIDLEGNNRTIEPLYHDGELDIYNSVTNENATLTLNGTVYATGDTEIGTPTGKGTTRDFTLNLNNETIFVESNSTGSGKEALKIGGKITLTGSGCIIAVGDIDFYPNIAAGSENDFILVMSVEGMVNLHPGGNFYGAIVGEVEVEAQSGKTPTIIWTSYEGEGIDFPIGQGEMMVLSYTIR